MGPQRDDLPLELEGIDEGPPPAPVEANISALAELERDLNFTEGSVVEMDTLLRDKKQLILSGPPGTGKTFVARKLAQLYGEGVEERVEFIQFHPSYAYEDFVEGFRPIVGSSPKAGDDQDAAPPVGFDVVPGPLLNMIERATEAHEKFPDDPPIYVMVIDEINRANLSAVFGELFFALEYRGESVRLQYSPKSDPMRLPENLWFIGTMNTADRSIAQFDAALRRRFYFYDLSPHAEPVRGALRRYLNARPATNSLGWLAAMLDHVNTKIPDPRYAVGPSHFMRKDLTSEVAERAWAHSVLPYLSDRFEDLVASGELDWPVLKARFDENPSELATDLATTSDEEVPPEDDLGT